MCHVLKVKSYFIGIDRSKIIALKCFSVKNRKLGPVMRYDEFKAYTSVEKENCGICIQREFSNPAENVEVIMKPAFEGGTSSVEHILNTTIYPSGLHAHGWKLPLMGIQSDCHKYETIIGCEVGPICGLERCKYSNPNSVNITESLQLFDNYWKYIIDSEHLSNVLTKDDLIVMPVVVHDEDMIFVTQDEVSCYKLYIPSPEGLYYLLKNNMVTYDEGYYDKLYNSLLERIEL